MGRRAANDIRSAWQWFALLGAAAAAAYLLVPETARAAVLLGTTVTVALVITRMVMLIRQDGENIAKLQAAETRFRTLVEQIPTVAYIDAADEASTNIYISPRIEELTGYSAEEWMGHSLWLEIMHPDDQERTRRAHARSLRSGTFACEYRVFAKDGRIVWIRDEARRVSLEDGNVIWQGILSDLTAGKDAEATRIELEQRLRQAQKMEAVGSLAGGIAHDFNNLLAVIQNYTRFVQEEIGDKGLRDDLEEVVAASERGATLVRQLLSFAHKTVVEPELLDVNGYVIDALPSLRRAAPVNVTFSMDLSSEPLRVQMDPNQLDQILVNLVENAVEAAGNMASRVVVETFAHRVDEAEAELAPGDYVCLRVSDTGRGMSADIKERIFEPFFTTKERASGTGLGLATVYGIARRVGGAIHVESAERAGSSFTVHLPSAEAIGRPAEPPEAEPQRGRRIRILVVEDEGAIARLLHRVLSDAGHDVETFVDPVEALAHLEKGAAAPDLLLADVLMPNMSGRDLAEKVIALHPSIRVVYMSGYSADIVARDGIVASGERYLQKPFTPEALIAEIERATRGTEVRA